MSRLDPHLQRVLSHGFELAVAVVWMLVGLAYVFNAQFAGLHSPIGRDLQNWHWVWTVMYLVGGPSIIVGIFKRWVNLRGAGLILLATGLSIQFVAALTADTVEFRTFTYGVYAAACLLKFVMLRGVYMHGRSYLI